MLADLNHSIKIGDNFISPVVKTATAVSTVLGSLALGTDYSDIKRLNPSTKQWESYAAGQFTTFNPGCGYNIIGLRNASFSYGKTETITSFVYDSTGARVKKTVGAAGIIYLGKDYEVEASLTTKYIFLGDRRITTKKSTGEIQFIHSDHISSSNVITDAAGNRSALLEYDPYGSTVTQTGTVNPKHKFTGQEADDSTKLYYYGARYYDPQLGRFITTDWYIQDFSNPQNLNLYTYVKNNPIKYTDPTGNFAFLIPFLIAAFETAEAIHVAVTALTVISLGLSAAAVITHLSGADKVSRGLAIGGFAAGMASALGGLSSLGAGSSGFTEKISITSFEEVRKSLGDGVVGISYVAHTTVVEIANSGIGASSGLMGFPAAAINAAMLKVESSPDKNNNTFKSSKPNGNWFPDRDLPRNPRTDEPLPDTNAPHTQLGRKTGRYSRYPQAREFNENGKPVRDIDFTNHGRADHPNPHQHRYKENPTGGTRERDKLPEPLSYPETNEGT